MTLEVAALIHADEESVLCWHLPEGRTSASVPDTRDLLQLLVQHKAQMAGTAHSHPGTGIPGPSWDDITTYAVVEKYLRGRYKHWVVSMDRMVVVTWCGPGRYDYRVTFVDHDKEPSWAEELRRVSRASKPQWEQMVGRVDRVPRQDG